MAPGDWTVCMSESPFDANEWKKFDPQSQKQILQAIESAKREKKIWYCPKGRNCDGMPHDDIDYNHARSDQWPPAGSEWFTWLIKSGRGSGKALSLDTRLPLFYNRNMIDTSTSLKEASGWTTMGQVKVGDVLFDENGNPTTVTAVYEPDVKDAYRIHFSDGSTIEACGDHLWVTHTLLERKAENRKGHFTGFSPNWAGKPAITTRELYETQVYNRASNHSIPLAKPLEREPQPLLVDPWVMGYWLGNGYKNGGAVTSHEEDQEPIKTLAFSLGYESGDRHGADQSKAPTFTLYGLMPKLREYGLLGNKHIPREYLMGSVEQRKKLFAGLLDSDGYLDEKKQQIEFCAVNDRRMAEDFMELARSLGQKPVLKEATAGYNGKVTGTRYRVTFRPSFNPFMLPRKSAKFRDPFSQEQRQTMRQCHRMIKKVEKIDPKPMRCITVDSPNSMFLAGEAMIPTHNTRSGAEWVRSITKRVDRIALVGRRGPDVRGTMIEGESGLINVCERAGMSYEWFPSRKEFVFGNGARAFGYSGEEPDTLRGPQHGAAWLDEPAHMPLIQDVWDNLTMGLRLAGLPGGAKVLCTSTPLPLKWLKDLQGDERTRTVTVSTHKNLVNLDETFRRNVLDKYEGTRLGRQELYGEILEDVEGALWTHAIIEPYRNRADDEDFIAVEDMDRIVVGVDPAGTSSKRRDETGIVVVGRRGDHFYVIDDYSGHYTPEGWARSSWQAYDKYNADAVIAEKNYGGEMVLSTLRNHRPDGNAKLVHSRRGKTLRAEPVVGLYEQGRVHHFEGLDTLEEQQTEWVPDQDDSPDRVDALVHAITDLSGGKGPSAIAVPRRRIGEDTSGPRTSTPFGLPVSGLLDHRGQPVRSW